MVNTTGRKQLSVVALAMPNAPATKPAVYNCLPLYLSCYLNNVSCYLNNAEKETDSCSQLV